MDSGRLYRDLSRTLPGQTAGKVCLKCVFDAGIIRIRNKAAVYTLKARQNASF